ncbi:hypothetical protein [Paracoccus aerius]|uniref:Holin n=1 Tax=Paracoccus aerius TaxID=1915382 RepID=A0ABS1S1S8_9RHOB|nr:hypothetical protein [Paracoccus aerius]MBL3672265.1 hypothetical protein [Paracoccus aerius]GHG11260.1 hypothetical protein GCM10017322_03430 [Paracoccus aerius]
MDVAAFIKEVGGGLAGVVIVVQGWFNWIQYRRNSDLQDKMLAMAENSVKESREILTETNKTTSANTEIMRRAVMLLEDKR